MQAISTSSRPYKAGQRDARMVRATTRAIRRRLAASGWYWEGWHAARPDALRNFRTPIIEDPTRPGGWCCLPPDHNI